MKSKLEQFVIDRQGKWFTTSECFKSDLVAAFTSSSGEVTQISVDDIGTILRSEFEAEAKRLGYINGYRWGVEYPTNGKRPDLADDVEILRRYQSSSRFTDSTVKQSAWHLVGSFIMVDPRHKPADTSYLNKPTQTQSLTHIEESLTDSDWHERGDAPPAGTECEVMYAGKFEPCFVVGMDRFDNLVVQILKDGGSYERVSLIGRFRPTLTEREKFIEQAWDKLRGDTPHKETIEVLGQLYDLGYRLPKVEK